MKEQEERKAQSTVANDADITSASAGKTDPDTQTAEWLLSQLSSAVQQAGRTDVMEGAELIATSGDLQALSALVGLMSEEDLESGMKLARIAGELWTVSDVVSLLDMPVLADFLESRGESLQQVAVDTLIWSTVSRNLAQVIGKTSLTVANAGAQEIREGFMRQAAAEEMVQKGAAEAAKAAREAFEQDAAQKPKESGSQNK